MAKPITSVSNAFHLVKLMLSGPATSNRFDWTVPDLAAELNLTRAQVRGLLSTLEAEGMVNGLSKKDDGRKDIWKLSGELQALTNRYETGLRRHIAEHQQELARLHA